MRFAGALMSNKLLKAETLAEATRPQFTTGAYGFGFQIGPKTRTPRMGHPERNSLETRTERRCRWD
jgi:hypothetical protein